jgi:hypothetical protein
MKNQNKKRPIDALATQSYSWLGKKFVLIKKARVRTWKGVFLLAFVAGIASTAMMLAYFDLETMSSADTVVSLALQNSNNGTNSVSLSAAADTFSLDIILNTAEKKAVVVRALVNYNPAVFEFQNLDTTESMFNNGLDCSDAQHPNRPCEIITNNSQTGQLDIVMAMPSPGVITTAGTVATLNFKVIGSRAQNSNITLGFVGAGNYNDSDVIVDDGLGTDILASVIDASIVFVPLDETAPVLAEVTRVTTPTSDTTPNYIFSSTEAGVITYGGSCASNKVTADIGNNTITFSHLAAGTYSNCTIVVTDAVGNVSAVLPVFPFVVADSPAISARGDVDQNGSINSTDAQLVLRKSLGLDMSKTGWQDSANAGDVNCDNNTNTTDAMLILKNSIGADMSATGWCL